MNCINFVHGEEICVQGALGGSDVHQLSHVCCCDK